jgi:transcriptional regulator with XRE-family HTH domain
MDATRRRRLEAAGFRVGSVSEFLDLTREEAAIVEMRLALSAGLRRWRAAKGLSQSALARQLGSSQSRVAKMEAGDPSVSLDLLMRALLTVGATPEDLGSILSNGPVATEHPAESIDLQHDQPELAVTRQG